MRRVLQGLLLILAVSVAAEEPVARGPERAEPPFAIYVFTAAGSDAKNVTEKWQKNLIKAAARVRDAVGTERNWLKAVDDKQRAELILEVTDIGYRKGRPGAKEQHLLEGKLIVFGADPLPAKGHAESERAVPADLIKGVARFCKANYAELTSKRQK